MAELVTRVTARESAQGPFRLLELAGQADITCRHLQEALDAEVAARPPLLVVDLSKLTFLDSWALHSILAASSELRAAGGSLALSSPTGEVRRVLELTGVDTLIPVYESLQEASVR